jgi:hypothetical protein
MGQVFAACSASTAGICPGERSSGEGETASDEGSNTCHLVTNRLSAKSRRESGREFRARRATHLGRQLIPAMIQPRHNE